jgi:hypothetical protein
MKVDFPDQTVGEGDEAAGHHVKGYAAQGAHLHVPHLVGSSQVADAD